MENKDLALLIAEAIDDKMGADIKVIKVDEICAFADYFVIASGASDRQVGAIAESAQDKMQEAGQEIKNREGKDSSGWILLDFGDIVVHIFSAEKRAHFNIEKLWNDGTYIDIENIAN